ncbi:hypothetical protein EDD85DRAFT_791184 [Armillaria nabsnona]|nr:hypothetical protein EDD85DRAFT_791184 [Armillaria nabsnona]
MESSAPPSLEPSALANNPGKFMDWVRSANVSPIPLDTTPEVEEQKRILKCLDLPAILEQSLIAMMNDPLEDTVVQAFTQQILQLFAGRFMSLTNDQGLSHTWKHLASIHANLMFAISPLVCLEPKEATLRNPTDTLMLLAVRTLVAKQNLFSIQYQHEVGMVMVKSYRRPMFPISDSLICDGQASYRMSFEDEVAIQDFAHKHGNIREVSTESSSNTHYFLLAMLVIAYEHSSSITAFHKLLLDFAAILCHHHLLGFPLNYLLGTTVCCTSLFTLQFFLGALDRETGHVQAWDVGELDIIQPAVLLEAYV